MRRSADRNGPARLQRTGISDSGARLEPGDAKARDRVEVGILGEVLCDRRIVAVSRVVLGSSAEGEAEPADEHGAVMDREVP
jgi:hypothetical protein